MSDGFIHTFVPLRDPPWTWKCWLQEQHKQHTTGSLPPLKEWLSQSSWFSLMNGRKNYLRIFSTWEKANARTVFTKSRFFFLTLKYNTFYYMLNRIKYFIISSCHLITPWVILQLPWFMGHDCVLIVFLPFPLSNHNHWLRALRDFWCHNNNLKKTANIKSKNTTTWEKQTNINK